MILHFRSIMRLPQMSQISWTRLAPNTFTHTLYSWSWPKYIRGTGGGPGWRKTVTVDLRTIIRACDAYRANFWDTI